MGEWRGNLKKNLILVFLAAILGALGIGFWQSLKFNDGKLHLVFCDVGQGDAIYVKMPAGQEVLIDGGPNERVLDCLSSHRPFFDRKIEILILTHPQADHLTGLIAVLKRYDVDYLVSENIFPSSAVFAAFRQAVAEEGLEIYNPKSGDRLRFGEAEINFYWPNEALGDKSLWMGKEKSPSPVLSLEPAADFNDYSLIFMIEYQNFISLLTGDAESQVLERISDLPSEVTVLKVPHHGSRRALNRQILDSLNPKVAVISVGKDNRYGHPAGETLSLLQDFKAKILRTDKDGEVEIIADGQRWRIE